MGWILLAVIVVCAGIDALIGVKRGIAFTGVRILLWAIGTLVAALTAKGITGFIVRKLAVRFGLEGATPAEIMTGIFKGMGLGSLSETVNAPAAGILLSALIPVVFAVLFIIMKFLSWVLFFVFKKIIAKTKAAGAFTERPLWSKIAGGVVNGVAGILACAIIASPISGLLKTVNDSGAADAVFHIMEVTAGGNKAAAKVAGRAVIAAMLDIEENGIIDDGVIEVYASDATVIGGADGPTSVFLAGTTDVEKLRGLYDSFVNSPASYVCKYVGAEGVAYAIYRGTSTVTPEDIGAEGKATLSYSFPDTMAGVLGIADEIDNTVTLLNDGAGFSTEMLDSVEAIVVYAMDSKLLAEEDKLDILNSSMPVLQENVSGLLGLGESVDFFNEYSTFDAFRSDVENIISLAHTVAESNVIGSNGFKDVDVNALIADTALMKEFVASTIRLSNGPEMIEGIVNAKVNEISKGKIPETVSAQNIRNAGEDKVLEACESLAEMTKYIERKSITVEEKDEIISKVDEISTTGILCDGAYATIKEMVENLVPAEEKTE